VLSNQVCFGLGRLICQEQLTNEGLKWLMVNLHVTKVRRADSPPQCTVTGRECLTIPPSLPGTGQAATQPPC